MKIFKSIIFLLAIVVGSSQLIAQTNLNGRYSCKSDKGSDSPSFSLTFERQDAVYYSYFYQGAGTVGGKWTIENGIINVTLTRGGESWTIKLKQKGVDLEIAENLPEMGLSDIPDFKSVLPVGTVFKKIVEQPTGPNLTSEDIGKRVLKLLKSVRSLKDISPKNLKRQTGVEVTFHEKKRHEYGFGGNVIGASDWNYGFYAYPYPSKDNKTTDTLRFSFDYQLHEPLNPDSTVICKAFEFNALSKELQQAGFSVPEPQIMNHNRLSGWRSIRGKVSLIVSVIGGWEPNIENCVTGIQISINK